jgi:PAS domain S-box-containing protein
MRLPLAIVLFGLATLALLWGGGIYESGRDARAALAQARKDTANVTLAFHEDVQRTIAAVDQFMLAIKAEYAQAPRHYHLKAWIGNSPLLDGLAVRVMIIDAAGRVRQTSPDEASPNALAPKDERSDGAYLARYLNPESPQPYISPPLRERRSGKWMIEISRRLEGPDGKTAGALVVSLDPLYLARVFGKVDLGRAGVVSIVGTDGIVRARRTADTSTVGEDIRDGPIFAAAREGSRGSFKTRSDIDGIERIYSYAAIPEDGLVVLVGVGRDEILAHIEAGYRHFFLGELGVSLFILLLMAVLLREVMRGQRREQAMAGQAALLGTILELTPAAIWVKDEAGRFEIANKAAQRLLGQPREALIGRTSAETMSPAIYDEARHRDAAARAQPGTTITGEHHVALDGKRHHFLTFRRTCDVDDRRLLVATGVDITPLRQAEAALRAEMRQREATEAQLRQAQKMETLGQLTGGIAHDFNNLLTTVLGNLELAERHEQAPDKLRLLRNATHAAERGATLIHHLLAFGRRQHLRPEPVDLNHLVAEAMEMLERALGPAIEIETALVHDLWPALADANQVEVALLNIAINARDAMPEGGRLIIRTANVAAADPGRASELPPGDFVALTVVATGAGMEEEVLARAFDPFFTTKEVGKGSGLGLSQVYGMARQSDGMVRLESQPGVGTAVHVYLPRAAAPAATDTGTPTPAPASRPGATIMVIDDNHQVRDFIAVCLEEHGYQVMTAVDGQTALAALDDEPVDLAIIDLAMPGLSGAEVARRARQRWPELRVLFITGYAGSVSLESTGDDPVFRKPFGSAKLLAEVERMLTSPTTGGR